MARKYAPNRIREIRTSKGLSMEELGLLLDPPASHSTIARLETQRAGLTLDYIQQIADVLQVSPVEIISQAAVSVYNAPVVASIVAGNWQEAIELSDHDPIPVPAGIAGPRAFLFKIDGDSMANQQDDGGYALVDPDDLDLIDGKQYLVMNEHGETTYKQYQASPAALIPLTSNPAHQPIYLGRQQFMVLGRVKLTLRLTD